MNKDNLKIPIVTVLFASVAFFSPAMAQSDRRAASDNIDYEFEFRYDREELKNSNGRRDINRRLHASADSYCENITRKRGASEYSDTCRREVVRETRRTMQTRRAADQSRQDRRYAVRSDD